MSTCLQTYVDIKHYHAYLVRIVLYVRTETNIYLFIFLREREREGKKRTISLCLSLSRSLLSFVIVVEPNLSRLDSRTFENSSSIEKREKTILRYPSLKESRFLNFKSLLSFFFFQFIIYNAFARNATTYFKSFHICHRSTTHVHIRSMSYTQYIYFIHIRSSITAFFRSFFSQ